MRNYTSLVLSFATLAMFSIVISSCKKDEPFVKPKLSFANLTASLKEGDSIQVEMKLDKAYSEDITVTYELKGTAVDQVMSTQNNPPDYTITSTYLETKIAKGQTSGIIKVKIYSDFEMEDDETIDINIKTTDNTNIEITRDDGMEITVKQENGMFTLLEWGVGTGEHYTDVDMDLMLWVQDMPSGDMVFTGFGSASPVTTSPEYLFLPNTIDDGTYGWSYNYYAGTVQPMNYQVTFAEFIDGAFEAENQRNVFKQSYTLKNINPWFESKVDPLLSQTFKKTGSSYSDFSVVAQPDTLSRTISSGTLWTVFNRHGKNTEVPSKLQSLLESLK